MTEPKTASEYLDRGCDKDDKKDSKGAIEDYNKAIELNPNYAEAYANRGCAKEELGDKEGAVADWQKAADLGDEEAAKWIEEVGNKQVNNESAKAQENAVDVELKKAKAATEQAKARSMHSASDLDDLDFMEKESGVSHAREMDSDDRKHRQQMENKEHDRLANLDKVAFDALTKQQQQ